MSYPACFDSQRDYDLWARLARTTGDDPTWPCIDCTKDFQRRMYREGRCEHPEVFPGEGRPCPVPSADDNPEVSSGETPPPAIRRGRPKGKKGQKAARKPQSSAPTAANSSSPPFGKSGPGVSVGPENPTGRTS